MFIRLFKYATKNMLRNPFLSISSVIILMLLMFFINILVVVHDVSFRIIETVNQKLTVSLYLKDEYDKNSLEVINLQNEIRSSIPNIDMQYKTKDEVLDELQKTDPDLVAILEKQNPLPETITLENIPLEKYNILNDSIQKYLYVLSDSDDVGSQDYFASYSQQYERIKDLIHILSMLRLGLYIIIVSFLISIWVIVYSIIGNFIYYYRDEIYITRLVGGSKIFIYGPFSLQGMIYVFLAFLFSVALFFLFLGNMKYLFSLASYKEIYTGNLGMILLGELAIFLCIGAMSGFFSSLRYLQKR